MMIIIIIHCECMFVSLFLQHAIRMRQIFISALPLYSIFPHYLINVRILRKIY